MRTLLAVLSIFVMTAVTTGSAQVLAQCMSHDELLAELATIFQERLFAAGISSRGALIEITVSPSGSFTVIVTNPPGISCMVMGGEAFELIPEPVPGKGT